jgi:hypothetical protein
VVSDEVAVSQVAHAKGGPESVRADYVRLGASTAVLAGSALIIGMTLSWSCAPKFEDVGQPSSAVFVVSRTKHTEGGVVAGQLLVAEWPSDGLCEVSGGRVPARLLLGGDNAKAPAVEADVACDNLEVIQPSELGRVPGVSSALREDELSVARTLPCYTDGPAPTREAVCTVVFQSLTTRFYIDRTANRVRVVCGRYGNRSGSEIETIYEVLGRSKEPFRVLVNVSRKVRFDSLPAWW